VNLLIILITIGLIGVLLTEPKAFLTFIGIVIGLIVLIYGGVYLMANVVGFLGGGRMAIYIVLGLMIAGGAKILFPSKDD